MEKITDPTRVQSAAEQPQSTKSPDFTRNLFFLFLLSFPLSLSLVAFAMVIACRTTPNDKKKKEKKRYTHGTGYRSLDSTKLRARLVARGRFLCWPHSGTHCTTPGGINSLPLSVDPTLASKMNCHCYFNREGRKEKRNVAMATLITGFVEN